MDKNLPVNAEDTGFIPGSGKTPHAMEQLSPCASTTEPALDSLHTTANRPPCYNYGSHTLRGPVLHGKRRHHSAKPAYCRLTERVAPARRT